MELNNVEKTQYVAEIMFEIIIDFALKFFSLCKHGYFK